ncbi:hypothetical protein [Deinococcus aquatilis]|uniref:hypothetical protein n=1 Tax=Deinococcus aquatilis TaxID=519440 RepID=UPI00039ABEDE|nr:hypothetical protein [Deinococcus aquatilis]
MSKASEAARARMITDVPRVPTIQPVQAVNRAKQEVGVPTAPTDPQSPNGVAEVNGQPVAGQDTPSRPLPEGLTPAARAALEGAGLTTLELALAKTDAELDAIPQIGEATITALRAAGQ